MTKNIISDVTGLVNVPVFAEATPKSTQDVVDAILRTQGKISIGGGRFSMGGQTAHPDSLHIDMREMNNVIHYSRGESITVQAGIRWHEIQSYLAKYDDDAVSIMQTYADFTVGGSLSVNAHGRYVGKGPLILSVLEIVFVSSFGEIIIASPTFNSDVFYGAIGGYGMLGVITEATLRLDPSRSQNVEQSSVVMPLAQYVQYFKEVIHTDPQAIFHNADLYTTSYDTVRAVTWSQTHKPTTHRDQKHSAGLRLPHKLALWLLSELPSGAAIREKYLAPLFFYKPRVHSRQFEAGYRVAELEPFSRKRQTYVLQEYFVPIDQATHFSKDMGKILKAYGVNVINLSIRHANKDPGSFMAWAKTEVFAFVLYYKQGTSEADLHEVAVWTRELVQTALDHGGRHYLPYQAHATQEQFERGYPGFQQLLELKNYLDPDSRFSNILWQKYGSQKENTTPGNLSDSDFRFITSTAEWNDRLYQFLEFVFKTYDPVSFHKLIEAISHKNSPDLPTDSEIYCLVQSSLFMIKKPLNDLFYGLPALFRQKKEMTKQTLMMIDEGSAIVGYAEIGSKGRYYSQLKKHLNISGERHFIEERAVTHSPVDIMERGGITIAGQQHLLMDDEGNYRPLSLGKSSISLMVCYIGLHHVHPDDINAFLTSISDALAEGGIFLLREHNVQTNEMHRFVSLIHSIFNLGLNETLEYDNNELRYFNSINYWTELLSNHGLVYESGPIYQDNDPSLNALLKFRKIK